MTGFSQAMPTAKNEADVAHQFIGFMEQFFRTFAGTRQKKLFLSGESYAGKYIPYIADAMLNVTGTEKFDLQGVLLIDRTDPETLASAADCIAKITSDTIAQDVPAVALMRRSEQTLGLSTRTMKGLQELADSCGYTRYLSENLVYPARPTGIPQVPQLDPDCHLVWEKLANAAFQVNPDFNIYSKHKMWCCVLADKNRDYRLKVRIRCSWFSELVPEYAGRHNYLFRKRRRTESYSCSKIQLDNMCRP